MVMKKISLFLLSSLSILLVSLPSCSTDFDLTGDFEPVPVIYGLLDQNDSIHYVKINRTFTGNGNPAATATIADSSYWDQVDAKVYEIEQTSQVSADTLRVWTLNDTILQNKDTSGIFFAPEQKVYYFIAGPNGANRLKDDVDIKYVLKVNLNGGAYYAEAITGLVRTSGTVSNPVEITSPNSSQDWSFVTFPFGNLDYTQDVLQWDIGNGGVFSVKMAILYDEYQGANFESKELIWDLGEYPAENITGTSNSIVIQGEAFYQYIGDKIDEDPSVTKRQFTGIRLDIVAGSEELYKFMQVTEPSTSLTQAQPTYTNIDGAYGLWASRTSLSQYKAAYNSASSSLRALSVNSLRALCESSQYTFDLKFCSAHPADNSQSWYCQ